ncbi:DUF3995 domain-containing protein [Agarivorans sp. JK6]|uniref:DUF3995 domain-containing protein n=1 Tax=Agarivorans sp. JK6 TaxID=2997426 RepID=UPI003873A270
MVTLSILVSLIMLFVSILHFYWAFGGKYGLKSAGPRLENKEDFVPSGYIIFMVACLLLGLSALAIQLINPLEIFEDNVKYFGYFIAFVFVVRAIGDFKYVGFFKKVYNSSFAKLDTKYFSPLILFLGVSYAVLAVYGT